MSEFGVRSINLGFFFSVMLTGVGTDAEMAEGQV